MANDQDMGRAPVEFEHELARAAERLVTEYEGRLAITTVIEVLSEVAHAHPDDSAERIEGAARERLQVQVHG